MSRKPVMRKTQDIARLGKSYRSKTVAFFVPRIWKLMIVASYPFLVATARYFEGLEHTGSTGAFLAATLMPAALVFYAGLIIVLKKRNI